MECRECQRWIQPYIEKELNDRELGEFLKHIEFCDHCYEELETFFMINRAVAFLDQGEENNFDLRSLLRNDIKEQKQEMSRRKKNKCFFILTVFLCVIVVLLLVLDYLGILPYSLLRFLLTAPAFS